MQRLVSSILFALILSISGTANAFLFYEDFGWGNEVNWAVPIEANGADNDWYAARFADGAPGRSISDDVGMSQMAYTDPKMHGWASDGAALLININTLGSYDNTILHFSWMEGFGDGIGRASFWDDNDDITGFNADRTIDLRTGPYNLRNWSEHDTSGPVIQWTQSSLRITDNKPSVWVAFWMLGGTQDYLRVTDIYVEGEPTPPVPEPSTLILIGSGVLGLFGFKKRMKK